jgi:hypothetical protein
LQGNRTCDACVADEGGAGSFPAANMKQSFATSREEVAKLETMVHDVVWAHLQASAGHDTFRVTSRTSLPLCMATFIAQSSTGHVYLGENLEQVRSLSDMGD